MQPNDDDLRQSIASRCDRISREEASLGVFAPGGYNRRQVIDEMDRLLARFPDPARRPSLFGLTVGVKDIFHCDGYITRCGSALPPELFQGPEADTVTRLKEAGAIVMGKTATTEFAWFAPAATRNPANPNHTPGGSSSGSAAGVAADFFDIALGTQTVGSVIRPAAYCGVVGFKPSFGRFSTRGVVPFSITADHVGVFARSVSDITPLASVLDTRGWKPAKSPDRIRLGMPAGPYLDQAEAPALSAFSEQIAHLEKAGCEVITVAAFEDIEAIRQRHTQLISAEIARVHVPFFSEQKKRYRQATREIIEIGMMVDDGQLDELRLSCPRLRKTIAEAMARYSLQAWICPATTGEAPRGLDTTGSPQMNLPWTHAGLPSVSLPVGRGSQGLPLGLQLVGGFMEDEPLIAIAGEVSSMIAT